MEVQKDDDDDHEYRVYYNGASMIVNNTSKGIMFKDLPRAIVIFISSFDVFEHGRLYYEMRKYTEQDKIPGRSPVTEIYINARATDDSTPKLERITKLMETMKLSAQEAMKSLKVPQKEWGDYEVKINGIMTPAK